MRKRNLRDDYVPYKTKIYHLEKAAIMLPNFMIIGQAKAGTSSLYNYLHDHPDIFMSPIKETRFFAFDQSNPQHLARAQWQFPIKTMEEYTLLFTNSSNAPAIGEASPVYFHSQVACARIRDTIPDVRLIASLRNPADRIYSYYNMRVREGGETRPFIQAFREGQKRYSANAQLTYAHLKRYYDAFGASQLKLIDFERFRDNPTDTLREVFEFLNIETDIALDTSAIHSRGGIPRSKLVESTIRSFNRNKALKTVIREIVPSRKLRGMIKSVHHRKPEPLPPAHRQEVNQFYREDTLRLQKLTDFDLRSWL